MTGVPALSYSQERVVAIETNAFAGTAYLEINRDDSGSLKSITYRSHDGRVLSYSLAQLRAGPQVIKQDGSHDVVFLSVEIDFSATKGGHANLRFLTNGIIGKYKNFRILIDAQNQMVLHGDANVADPQSDRNPYTAIFNYLYLAKSTFIGKTIGIESVSPGMR